MESLSRGQKALRIAGYVTFFIIALLIGIRLTLPTEQASELIKAKLTETLDAERVDIGDLSLRGLIPSGVEVEDFALTLPPVQMKTPERGGVMDSPSRTFMVEEFIVDGSVFGLAKQDIDLEFEGRVQGGTVEGGIFQNSPTGPFKLKIEKLEKIALGSEALFLTLTGFDLIGDLGGTVDLTIPRQEGERGRLQLEQLTGGLTITLSEALIAQPVIDTTMNRETMRLAFTDIDLGNILVRVQTEAPNTELKGPRRGVFIIDELSITGGDLEVISAPRSMITIPAGGGLRDATINMHLILRIAEGWFDREMPDPKDPTKMTKPNSGLRTMMTMGPLKNVMVDGQFGLNITGSLMKPNINPQRPRVRIQGAPPAGSSAPSTGSSSRRVNVNQGVAADAPSEPNEDAPAIERNSRPTRAERSTPVVPAAPMEAEDDQEDDIAPEQEPAIPQPTEGSVEQQAPAARTPPLPRNSTRGSGVDRRSERFTQQGRSLRPSNVDPQAGIRTQFTERARPSLGAGIRQRGNVGSNTEAED